MSSLTTKFLFDKHARLAAATAQSVVCEALAKNFSPTIAFAWHRELLSRELLMKDAPHLLGVLPALVANGDVTAAIALATEALEAQRDTRPMLYWSSRTATKERAYVWHRKAYPHRGESELFAECDRAFENTRFELIYNAALRLQAEGIDVEELRQRIDLKNPTHQEIVQQRAVAMTPSGQISGYDNATPQIVGDGLVA